MSIIKVENLSKKYMISHSGTRGAFQYKAFRDLLSCQARRLANAVTHPFRSGTAGEAGGPTQEEFWALKDINFEIEQGDRVGIIGRNGAGKSTLLKVLSRIVEPTSGKITMNGRVASLLEVGTGFHPELTGRENIYLNGAILGMSRAEIRAKFDEIVDFAEVEKFLDTPVKHYSSGMYVRLAFAVAAHLEPEILLVDEVLAVGDAQFQKKCLGKMEDISQKEGRTVFFVSHTMSAITSLCSKAILLKAGKIGEIGSATNVVEKYLLENAGGTYYDFGHERNLFANTYVELIEAWVSDGDKLSGRYTLEDAIMINITFRIKEENNYTTIPVVNFFLPDGTCAFASNGVNCKNFKPGIYTSTCIIPPHFLNEKTYVVAVGINSSKEDKYVHHYYNASTLVFTVIDTMNERSERYGYVSPYGGVIHPLFNWKYEIAENNIIQELTIKKSNGGPRS